MRGELTKSSPGSRARCIWEVTAGILPGKAMPEFTERWCVTSETFYREAELSAEDFAKEFPDGRSTFIRFRDEAYEYARNLTDPRSVNWVRVDWVYY